MTAPTWTPRPAYPDEPACWSWPIPPVSTYEEALAGLAAAAEHDPLADPDERRDPRAYEYLLVDLDVHRFNLFHDGRCALCGGTWERCGGRMVVDHDHVTGMWRGLLGKACNTSEGRGSSLLLDRYRGWHPAAILGLHEPYSGNGWTRGWSWREHGAASQTNPPRTAPPWPSHLAVGVLDGAALAEING